MYLYIYAVVMEEQGNFAENSQLKGSV